MTEFLTTSGVSSNLERIIGGAQKRLVLISPYLQFPAILFERLQQADRRGVQIVFIYGKKELKDEEQSKLKQLRNLSLHFYENLHAKCYLNESDMIITSMNLVEYSEKNNREMGILIHRSADEKLFDDARCEADSILYSSRKVELVPRRPQAAPQKAQPRRQGSEETGHCIRCNASIPLDPNRPYCNECFSSWVRYGDPYYEDKRCHLCGKSFPASMAKPLCNSCYVKHQNDDWAQPIVDTFRKLFGH
jgi:hypothetical protein